MEDLVRPEIEDYAEQHSMGESAVCRELREETERTMELARMLVGPLEAAFLKMMVKLVRARRVLEIGMFTGYSALSMAEALPPDGQVITCEIDPEPIAMARRYFARSGQGGKITIREGPALETLQDVRGPFDLIFIDADKQNYINYYKRALELIAPTGVILIDNVLWSGDVLMQPPPDDRTRTIQDLNRLVAEDPRVSAVLVTIRDGVLVVKPEPGVSSIA
jgi:caffeoyl-CoA O-methyltransferase